jgi:hypothetical protein
MMAAAAESQEKMCMVFVFPTASSLAKFIVSNSKALIYKTCTILIYVVYMKV